MHNNKPPKSKENLPADRDEREMTDAEIAARSLEGKQPFRDKDAKIRTEKSANRKTKSEREEKVNSGWDEDEIESKEPSEKPPRSYRAKSVGE